MSIVASRCHVVRLSLLVAFFASGSPLAAQEAILIHETTAANRPDDWRTIVDEPLINNNPNAIFLVNQALGAVGGPVFNPHPVGLYYRSDIGRWTIENQDQAVLPLGSDFFVWIPGPGATTGPAAPTFLHTSTALNVSGNQTTLDHPLLNGNPNQALHVTAYGPTELFPHEIGTWYKTATNRWTIFNEDLLPMPAGIKFNVCITNCGLFTETSAWNSLVSSAGNIIDGVAMTFPTGPNRPVALVSRGFDSVYLNHPLGVEYDIPLVTWYVINEDLGAMPVGVRFYTLTNTGLYRNGFESGNTFGWTVSP